MRFTFIITPIERLPNLKIIKGEDGNLATLNIGVTIADAYFTCGDLVFNYNKEYGEVVSVDGYLPYFDTLTINENLNLPEQVVSVRLYVADLTQESIFKIDSLPIEISRDKRIIHAGKNASVQYIKMSDSVYIGLSDGEMTDIYIGLE